MAQELPPPFVTVAGLANIRDIGGWPIADANGNDTSSTVRKGVLYRGPDPSNVEPAGLAKLKELRITVAFDLRSRKQVERAGGIKIVDGVERVECSVFGDGESGPEKAAARYLQYSADGTDDIVEAFGDILTSGAEAFRTILLHISSFPISDTRPASLLHCTTGNNRTGVLVGALLYLLNVSPANIAAEYALSDIGLAPSRPAVVARLAKSPVFAGPGGGGKARAERMVRPRPEVMLAMLEMVDRKWGGPEAYFKEVVGLSETEIDRVKLVMVA